MPDWKTAFRSIYYQNAPEPEDPVLKRKTLALLVIDVQNTYLERPDVTALSGIELETYHAWDEFHARMHDLVLPTIARLLARFRKDGLEVIFARIACQTMGGRDRSLSQKMPGWNNILLPRDSKASQIVPMIAPINDEIVVIKTTDSALTVSIR